MKTTLIHDKNNMVIGKIIDEDSQSRIFDKSGNFAGRYDRKTDRTFSKNGNYFGTGDQLRRLIN